MGWRSGVDEPTHDSGLGFHVAALDVSRLSLVGASNLPGNAKRAAPGTAATIKSRQPRPMRH